MLLSKDGHVHVLYMFTLWLVLPYDIDVAQTVLKDAKFFL